MRFFKLRKIINKYDYVVVYNNLKQKIHDNMLHNLPCDYDLMKVKRIESATHEEGMQVFLIHLK